MADLFGTGTIADVAATPANAHTLAAIGANAEHMRTQDQQDRGALVETEVPLTLPKPQCRFAARRAWCQAAYLRTPSTSTRSASSPRL